MKWITRSHVHVDRVACPWLITRFIDSNAEFLFVPKSKLMETAEKTGLTVVGFPRSSKMVVYTHTQRVEMAGPAAGASAQK